MKRNELETLCNYYGYDLRELVDDWRYKDRKGKVYAIYDRRCKQEIATYSTLTQVESFLKRHLK